MGIAEIIALVSVLSPVVVQVLRLLSAKIENEKTQKIFQDAATAVTFAEELANANPELVKGGKEKLDQAVRAFQARNPKIPVEQAKVAIQAALPHLGIGATAKKKPVNLGAVLNGQ